MSNNSDLNCCCYRIINLNNNFCCKLCLAYYKWNLCNEESCLYYKKIYNIVKENPTYCFKLINSKKKELNNFLNVHLVNLCFEYDLMYYLMNKTHNV